MYQLQMSRRFLVSGKLINMQVTLRNVYRKEMITCKSNKLVVKHWKGDPVNRNSSVIVSRESYNLFSLKYSFNIGYAFVILMGALVY